MASSFHSQPAATFFSSPNPGEQFRVSIVEDDKNDCRIMSRMVEQSQEFTSAGVYHSAKEALEAIPKAHPHVVLMDIRIPGMSGIECARRLRAGLPSVVVIFITGLSDAGTMTEAFKAGGGGYLAKPFSIAQFLATLRFAVWQRAAKTPKSQNTSACRIPSLNPREKAVMDGLSSGLLYKEMAEQLKCSLAVIKKLQHSAFLKLGVTKNTEAVRCWLRDSPHEVE
jgi:DNA-binding NarL/FixJ family response regulator